MKRMQQLALVLFSLSLFAACGSPPPPVKEPTPAPDWGDALRRFALVGLRALVCEEAPAAEPPPAAEEAP